MQGDSYNILKIDNYGVGRCGLFKTWSCSNLRYFLVEHNKTVQNNLIVVVKVSMELVFSSSGSTLYRVVQRKVWTYLFFFVWNKPKMLGQLIPLTHALQIVLCCIQTGFQPADVRAP